MRAIWTGAIAFGLVNIPVKLYSAAESTSLDLDMLDKRDHSPIRYARINKVTNQEVPWNDTVKGYKQGDNYIVVTDEDFDTIRAERTDQIEIERFVDASEVDTTFFEKPYYLEPDRGGSKPYALLREALKASGKVGLARYVLRGRANLAILEPGEGVLVLNKIRFAQEIRSPEELNLPYNVKPSEAEMDMARQLIETYSKPFDINDIRDDYRDKLMEIIEAKAAGEQPVRAKVVQMPAQTADLMAQLKASLAAAKGGAEDKADKPKAKIAPPPPPAPKTKAKAKPKAAAARKKEAA